MSVALADVVGVCLAHPERVERKNSYTKRQPAPVSIAVFLRPDIRLWPGGRRIQDPKGKEVRLACLRFLASWPPHARV